MNYCERGLTDVAAAVSGPGEWSVKVSGSDTNWFYTGSNRHARIVVDASGGYTISGGDNMISGRL